MHEVENGQYNPMVLAGIIERQNNYRLELRKAGFFDWALRLVGSDIVQVADCLIHFVDPKYRFEGRLIFKFLFSCIENFEEFRNDRLKWMPVIDCKNL